MAYISKHHLGTARSIEVHQIKFLGYGGYNMPHVNNVNFSESKFALLFRPTTEDNFWKLKQHLVKKWSIHNK